MCIVWTRHIAPTPFDTARTAPAPSTTFPVAPLTRGLRAALAGAGATPAALAAGTTRAAPAAIRLIHPAGTAPASLHFFLLNRPLDNDAALQHDLN